ncbi:hypothetical protein KR074_008002 [Drosophila pseudoananassae]|nr:hypothetical protein KR074_008002 [Drosophila pseudoananassae]
MMTRVGIIGQCQFCQRLVGIDMRPVDDTDVQKARSLDQQREETVSKVAVPKEAVPELDDKPGCSGTQAVKKASSGRKKNQKEVLDPLKKITGTIMRLVKEEFARPPGDEGSLEVSRANAEVIITMLAEEERIVEEIRSQASSLSKRIPKKK